MSTKDFRIDLDLQQAEPGSAAFILAALLDTETFEEQYRLRKPLGIYNVSILRINNRLSRLARSLRDYMKGRIEVGKRDVKDQSLIPDLIESCMYAAAEHVDDLESCLKCFFPSEREFARSKAVRQFKNSLKSVRRNVSAFANAIKHQQARVRLYELEFCHDSNDMLLVGFFVEGVEKGEIGPSVIVHGEDVRVVSAASFLWEVITFVHEAASLLSVALADISAVSLEDDDRLRWAIVREAFIEVAKVANFSLDDRHPFERRHMQVEGQSRGKLFTIEDMYGSIGNRWTFSSEHSFGGTSLIYEGDSVSTKFALADPKQVRIQHWRDAFSEAPAQPMDDHPQ